MTNVSIHTIHHEKIPYLQSSVTFSHVGPIYIYTRNLSYPNQKKEAPVDIDLAVPSSSPIDLFNRKRGSIAHSLLLSLACGP